MKVLGVLLLLVGLCALGVFLWPVVNPQARPAAEGAAEPTPYRRARVVARAATPPPIAEAGSVAAARAAAEKQEKASARPGAAHEPRGPLCDQLFEPRDAPRISLPKGAPLEAFSGHTGSALSSSKTSKGWQWVNLWAAWCKPCKAEMPILKAWAEELGERAPGVTYLSLDDDERQLARYLSAAGRAYVDRVLWVNDEGARAHFFNAAGLENPPTLPVQLILDPDSRLRCVRVGSLTRADLDEAARRFAW